MSTTMVAGAQLTGAVSASGDRNTQGRNITINTAAAIQLCWLQPEQHGMTLPLAGFTENMYNLCLDYNLPWMFLDREVR